MFFDSLILWSEHSKIKRRNKFLSTDCKNVATAVQCSSGMPTPRGPSSSSCNFFVRKRNAAIWLPHHCCKWIVNAVARQLCLRTLGKAISLNSLNRVVITISWAIESVSCYHRTIDDCTTCFLLVFLAEHAVNVPIKNRVIALSRSTSTDAACT